MGTVRTVLAGTVLLALLGGCDCCEKKTKQKRQQAFDPAEQYPEWAYDAPYYYRPAMDRGDVGEAVLPEEPGGTAHYYVRSRTVYLPRPEEALKNAPSKPDADSRTVVEDFAPRIGVYWSDSWGEFWSRAGYFGLGQTHFAFPAENDGIYGFRFVGPGLRPAMSSPPQPHVVYHVDTVPPEVVVYIEPCCERYHVGETLMVHWQAEDATLGEKPVSLSACWQTHLEAGTEWTSLAQGQPAEGSMPYVVPAEAAGQTLRIQVVARDRAGNVGVGVTGMLIVAETLATTQPAPTSRPVATTSRPGQTAMEAFSFLDQAELASHTEDAPGPAANPLRVRRVRTIHAKKSRRPGDAPTAPAPSLDELLSGEDAGESPWQGLLRRAAANSPCVWSLPVRRLPMTVSPMDDTAP